VSVCGVCILCDLCVCGLCVYDVCDLCVCGLCVPPSLGFSRQEYWSGLPFPSPMHESEK